MMTMPRELLEAVDEAASDMKHKRSQVVRLALREWLERRRQQQFESLLAEGYQEMAQAAGDAASHALRLQSAATEAIWRWND